MNWYEKAMEAASRIDAVHTPPWKLAVAYSLLAIAGNLEERRRDSPTGNPSSEYQDAARTEPATMRDILSIEEVAGMTGVPLSTLRYWRHLDNGPKPFRLGGRIKYRRADVEAWIKAAA